MNIKQNVPLSEHSTMRLGGTAAYCADITNRTDLREAITWAYKNKRPVVTIGGGSNIVWRDEGFDGLGGPHVVLAWWHSWHWIVCKLSSANIIVSRSPLLTL